MSLGANELTLIKKEKALKISPPLKIPIVLSISHHFIAKVTMGIS